MSTIESSRQIFESAIAKYGIQSIHPEVTAAKSNILKFMKGQLQFTSDQITVVVTDPIEEFDDLIMLLYGVLNTTGTIIVVISGGYFTPDQRLEYLTTFEKFKGASFEQPFIQGETTLLFVRDGETIPHKIQRFINCGPCSSVTLNSFEFVEPTETTCPILITVGANDDGTASAGVNQRLTDEPNKLITNPEVWNSFIAKAKSKGVIVKNMSVDFTRYVLFPNPLKQHVNDDLLKPELLNAMLKTAAMFIISRPPPIGLRANVGNSIIDLQMFSEFDPTDEKYQQGLIKIDEYKQLALSNGLEYTHYEAAAIPIMITYCIGGVYKEKMFGFSPTDKHAKETLGCLTPESAEIVLDYIKHNFNYLTPAYDPLAYMEAFLMSHSITEKS
jgi:hypothetical protein